MTSVGRSHGSITVVNAIPCGIGAALGVDLVTEAVFSIRGNERTVSIRNDPGEDDGMARICVERAFEHAGMPEPEGWSLEISSEIPISKGLKSSSAACNAILRSVFSELGTGTDGMDLIRLGVGCAREAGVTVTGSFDDACGCGLGGFVMTDNRRDELMFRKDVPEHDVIIHVPEYKIRKTGLPMADLRGAAQSMRRVIETAADDPFRAMTMNGTIISRILGVDNGIADRAMAMGALGAGMSGTGPAVAVVVEKGTGRAFAEEMGIAEVLITATRCGE